MVSNQQMVWVFGCGRTGSTWLMELLAFFRRIRIWNEPRFGDLIQWIEDPGRGKIEDFLFATQRRLEWLTPMAQLFRELCFRRFGDMDDQDIVVIKEVNAPRVSQLLPDMFPGSRFVLLLRDPFDVLDSFLDMQKPGAWNSEFVIRLDPAKNKISQTATFIDETFKLSLAGYEVAPQNLRFCLAYEDLLRQPATTLSSLLAFIGYEFDIAEIQASIDANSFQTHWEVGAREFRRFGMAGRWQKSENFDPATRDIAERVLGPLRAALGYSAEPKSGL